MIRQLLAWLAVVAASAKPSRRRSESYRRVSSTLRPAPQLRCCIRCPHLLLPNLHSLSQPAPYRAMGSARMAFQLPRCALTRKTLRMLLSAADTSWGLVLNFWNTYNLTPAVVAAGCLPELACLPPAPRRVCIGRGIAALNSRRHDGRSTAGSCIEPRWRASVAGGFHHCEDLIHLLLQDI